ncbi:MAG: VOC family protein [Ktedonobacteraceae bacterium]|nr:VOC family protein [Ktedonobacteraceae bacterium]
MPNFIGVRHVGWGVKDPVALAAFYRDVMGMTVVAETPAASFMGATVFISRHPEGEEHHDLVFFSNPMFAHTAFRVSSLAELLSSYREIKERGIPITFTFNHGVALSFYFDDPEGHNIEIYWLTNVRVPQDYQVRPINLDLPEEEVLREVERLAEQFGRRSPSPSH